MNLKKIEVWTDKYLTRYRQNTETPVDITLRATKQRKEKCRKFEFESRIRLGVKELRDKYIHIHVSVIPEKAFVFVKSDVFLELKETFK